MLTINYDPATGRPLRDDEEAVETLTDEELETELTVVSYDAVRRSERYDRLWHELLQRRRGYRKRRLSERLTAGLRRGQ
jgi:hypothetical protein